MSDGNITDIDDFIDGLIDGLASFTPSETPTGTPTEEEDFWPAYYMWIQKPFATLSILSSYIICREVISDLKQNSRSGNRRTGGRTAQFQRSIGRILVNLSFADILFSIALFMGEWPSPKDTLYIHHAAGNQQICTFQGWLRALGYLASPMFSVALNVFYLLLIRYRWVESDLARLEKRVSVGIWIYCFILAIIPIPLEAYNADYDVCWVAAKPLDCPDEECTRGLIAKKLEIYFSLVHIWVAIFVCCGLMFYLFWTVKTLEDKTKDNIAVRNTPVSQASKQITVVMASHQEHDEAAEKNSNNHSVSKEAPKFDVEDNLEYSTNNNGKRSTKFVRFNLGSVFNRNSQFAGSVFGSTIIKLQSSTYRKTKAVATQGILYTLAFMATHLFDMISTMVYRETGKWDPYFDLVAFMVLQPSLGIINFLIFSRNRKKMVTPEGRLLRKVVCCCGVSCNRSSSSSNNVSSVNNSHNDKAESPEAEVPRNPFYYKKSLQSTEK